MHLNYKNKVDFYQCRTGIHRSPAGASISLVVVILLLLITPGMSWAQSGVIIGTVIDGQTGQPLAGTGVSVEDDSIFVFASQQEKSQALNVLQGSGHAASFITSEQMDRFGDYTIQDAVLRLPGVQAVGRNEINLRGARLMQYRVTVDGQRMATTGLGDRGVDLGMLDADLYRQLELKVLRPDAGDFHSLALSTSGFSMKNSICSGQFKKGYNWVQGYPHL